MKTLPTLTAMLLLGLLLSPPATAIESRGCGGRPCIGILDIAGTIYVDDTGYGPAAYMESNGTPGLQRGASCGILVPDDCVPCDDGSCDEAPDTRII